MQLFIFFQNSSTRFPQCDICNCDFNASDQQPLLLPCGHGFCLFCLQNLMNTGQRKCAHCRDSSWSDIPLDRLPVVKSLIHPENANKVNRNKKPAGSRKLSPNEISQRFATMTRQNLSEDDVNPEARMNVCTANNFQILEIIIASCC